MSFLLRGAAALDLGEAGRDVRLLFWGRGLRAFGDGLVSLLLPAYLECLGFDAFRIGILTAATLAGSAAVTTSVGMTAHRYGRRALMVAASLLMIGTGLGFLVLRDFWPLVAVAFVGTLNPSSGDVSLFNPLEQAMLAEAAPPHRRTGVFAFYSLIGSLVGAFGALAAGFPQLLRAVSPMSLTQSLQSMFVVYTVLGLATYHLYRRLPSTLDRSPDKKAAPLGPSRGIVLRLTALFTLDSLGGGLLVQSLLALWLYQRFGVSLALAGTIFFWIGIFNAVSYLAAPPLARRIGLVETMAFTHLPASFCVMALPFSPSLTVAVVLLVIRSLLSNMDVPARTSYVMAMVTPAERPAAASIAALPRSLASAVGPLVTGYLLALSSFGWAFFAGGAIKGTYDLLLLALFRRHRPPEERVDR
jgi:MFS family permease